MGVYQRRDSPFWWMLCERPGDNPLVTSTKIPVAAHSIAARNVQKRTAEDVYRAKMTDLARARSGLPLNEPDTITFNRYSEWYDTHHLAQRRGADRDRATLKHLRAFFADDDLRTISRARTQEYITHRLAQPVPHTIRKVKPRTVNREVSLLKEMLRDAVPLYLATSPLAGMKMLRIVKPKKRILRDAHEEARLLAELSNPADQAFVIVAIDTLIRLSNVINLKWSEVKRTRLELEDSKTGAYSVTLSARAREALAMLPRDGEYCFPHRHGAKKERDVRGAVRTLLERACARAGIPYGRNHGGVTFHTATRATGATRLMRTGADLKTLQDMGNWKDVRSLDEYLHADQKATTAAVKRATPKMDLPKAVAVAQANAAARRIEAARKGGIQRGKNAKRRARTT